MAKDIKRSSFLVSTAATVVAAVHAEPAIAEAVTASGVVVTVPIDAAARATTAWWKIYTMWNPGTQKYPGSLLMPLVRDAESGDARSLATLKAQGIYDEIKGLLAMRARGETIHPRSAAYGKPALTAEEQAIATVLKRS